MTILSYCCTYAHSSHYFCCFNFWLLLLLSLFLCLVLVVSVDVVGPLCCLYTFEFFKRASKPEDITKVSFLWINLISWKCFLIRNMLYHWRVTVGPSEKRCSRFFCRSCISQQSCQSLILWSCSSSTEEGRVMTCLCCPMLSHFQGRC